MIDVSSSGLTNRALLALVLCGTVSLSFSSSPAIGLAVTDGGFQVDHASVWGNATLFDGNLIETSEASSRLQLRNGVAMRLASDSRARIYDSRLVLEKGTGQLESVNYRIEADGLRVSPDSPGSVARVQVDGENRIVVAAYQGSVRVSNSQGVLVARLETGRELAFEPQAEGTAGLTKVSGCLLRKDGQIVIVDGTTNVVIQLQGAGLDANLGSHVEITGGAISQAPTVAGASQIVNVSDVKLVAKGGCASVAKKIGAAAVAGAAAGAAAGGLSTGAIVAIVAGVAAIGSTVGLAAANALPGQGTSAPATSR
jgi:hypothetical protein